MIRLSVDKAAAGRGERNIIRVESSRSVTLARAVEWTGKARFVVNREHPIQPAGTYAWVEVDGAVTVYK